MFDSSDSMSLDSVKVVGSPRAVRTKPKKRSLVERELETNLTERVTSPVILSEHSSTSRYGRARRIKTESDSGYTENTNIDTWKFSDPTIPITKHSPVYKMHASNSPVQPTSPTKVTVTGIKFEKKTESVSNEKSLSRFINDTKASSPRKTAKIFIRKDLVKSNENEETASLIKTMFSPTKSNVKSNTHSRNKSEQSTEQSSSKGNDNQRTRHGCIDTSSVVKALDFDCDKKKNKDKVKVKTILSKNELFEMEATCVYQVGDLAWARVGTFPFWPCIVTREPLSGMFMKKKSFGRVQHDIIHVTFFGDNGRRSWIVDNMLRKYVGLEEFEATRDQFTPEAKKKDRALHAAFFISEKKQALWNISVQEADSLLREPKRFRIDIFNDLLEKTRLAKMTPKRASGIQARTNSDVSLSESLLDTLFSEDDRTDDSDRSKNKQRNKTLDVSDVVTACLDNMAAKTGLTKIQKQSHMDRWLQKAKSKTPEKFEPKNEIFQKITDIDKSNNSKKKKKSINGRLTTSKPYPLRRSATEQAEKIENNSNLHEYDIDSHTLDISKSNLSSGSDVGITVKVETLSESENVSIEPGNLDLEQLDCEINKEAFEGDSEDVQKIITLNRSLDNDSKIGNNTLSIKSLENHESNGDTVKNISECEKIPLDIPTNKLIKSKHQPKDTDISSTLDETKDILSNIQKSSPEVGDQVQNNISAPTSHLEISHTDEKNKIDVLGVSSMNIESVDIEYTDKNFQNLVNSNDSCHSDQLHKLEINRNKEAAEYKMIDQLPVKLDDPEFRRYLDLRQDALIDEYPQLTEKEIVNYLYKTWTYEDSLKFDDKNTGLDDQSELVRGMKMNIKKRVWKKKAIKQRSEKSAGSYFFLRSTTKYDNLKDLNDQNETNANLNNNSNNEANNQQSISNCNHYTEIGTKRTNCVNHSNENSIDSEEEGYNHIHLETTLDSKRETKKSEFQEHKIATFVSNLDVVRNNHVENEDVSQNKNPCLQVSTNLEDIEINKNDQKKFNNLCSKKNINEHNSSSKVSAGYLSNSILTSEKVKDTLVPNINGNCNNSIESKAIIQLSEYQSKRNGLNEHFKLPSLQLYHDDVNTKSQIDCLSLLGHNNGVSLTENSTDLLSQQNHSNAKPSYKEINNMEFDNKLSINNDNEDICNGLSDSKYSLGCDHNVTNSKSKILIDTDNDNLTLASITDEKSDLKDRHNKTYNTEANHETENTFATNIPGYDCKEIVNIRKLNGLEKFETDSVNNKEDNSCSSLDSNNLKQFESNNWKVFNNVPKVVIQPLQNLHLYRNYTEESDDLENQKKKLLRDKKVINGDPGNLSGLSIEISKKSIAESSLVGQSVDNNSSIAKFNISIEATGDKKEGDSNLAHECGKSEGMVINDHILPVTEESCFTPDVDKEDSRDKSADESDVIEGFDCLVTGEGNLLLPNKFPKTKHEDDTANISNGLVRTVKEEIDSDTLSNISKGEENTQSKQKLHPKNVRQSTNFAQSLEDTDFIKYVEFKQDAIMDEHPELSQKEIINYLYKTWLYEESIKSDTKKADEMDQSELVKGLNTETVKPKRIRKKKIKYEKNLSHENKEHPSVDIQVLQKPRRKLATPFYNYEFSDLEDEIECFEITKHKKSPKSDKIVKEVAPLPSNRDDQYKEAVDENIINVNEDEIIDVECLDQLSSEERYFTELIKIKPNIFKGLLREKVCQVCEKIGNLSKCNSCRDMFHVECGTKEINHVEEITTPSRKKRKKPRSKKLKGLDDSESPSDEKCQDTSNSDEQHNFSLDETFEVISITIPDAETFESKIEAKIKELIEKPIDLNYDSSDCELDWNGTVAGKCEIVDVQLKLKTSNVPIIDENFKCMTCQKNDIPVCFVCKSHASPKSGNLYRQNCHLSYCHKYYHLECLDHWPQTQFNHENKLKLFGQFTCPRHVCHTCVCDDPRGCKTRFSADKLVRCVRCPATYHCFSKCVPAGSQILTGSLIICPRHYKHRPGKVPCHVNTGWCFICALGGSLICCEYCPTSFHAECLNIKPPEGNYMCEDCETGRLPLYGEMVWVKLGHYRWWPGLILHPSEIPANILAVKHQPGEFVVRFFGQYDYYWVNRGRVFPFQEGDSGRISTQKSKIDEAFSKAVEHAQRACAILKNAAPNPEESQELAQSLLPPQYVKLKCNKPVGTLVNWKPDHEEHSLTLCECDPREEEPCGPYSTCLNRMLLTECGPSCRAGDRCENRAFEKRQYPNLVPYRTSWGGWGLKTLEDIKQGQFVIEYVGELIDEKEFQRRMKWKHEIRDENYYFLTLDKERMIDAGPKGNLARFMNHCCEPNCETQKWTVLGDIRVGLFALHHIPAGSEVTFNYNLESTGIEKKQCLCGAKRCSGYIGAKPKQQNETLMKKPNTKVPTKRFYKKKKPAEAVNNKVKPKRLGRPPKPKELTEIEKDLLIIKNATNGLSSDSETSCRLSIDNDKKPLKRKRVSFSTEEKVFYDANISSPSAKKVKLLSDD